MVGWNIIRKRISDVYYVIHFLSLHFQIFVNPRFQETLQENPKSMPYKAEIVTSLFWRPLSKAKMVMGRGMFTKCWIASWQCLTIIPPDEVKVDIGYCASNCRETCEV
jgi:hypothetical protein